MLYLKLNTSQAVLSILIRYLSKLSENNSLNSDNARAIALNQTIIEAFYKVRTRPMVIFMQIASFCVCKLYHMSEIFHKQFHPHFSLSHSALKSLALVVATFPRCFFPIVINNSFKNVYVVFKTSTWCCCCCCSMAGVFPIISVKMKCERKRTEKNSLSHKWEWTGIVRVLGGS